MDDLELGDKITDIILSMDKLIADQLKSVFTNNKKLPLYLDARSKLIDAALLMKDVAQIP